MLNQIALIGRLTKDPEIKLVGKDQNSVVRFILYTRCCMERNG